MGNDEFDEDIEGQLTFDDILNPASQLVAVSRIFARARKEMTLPEQKTFVYALSHIKFREKATTDYIMLNKRELAEKVGVHSDANHRSVDLYNQIKDITAHSRIEFEDRDKDIYANGFLITEILSEKDYVRITFNNKYLPLFTGLSTNYITLWSEDIFHMDNKRTVQFYEFLRQCTDTRKDINSKGLGIKALKEMFGIPKDGRGSYMTKEGHFARTHFERKVIDPICENLAQTKMIQLVIQPDGKYYEKIKSGNKVLGYKFYWRYTSHPAVASANEVNEIQEKVDKNPQILKVAKDIVKGKKQTIQKKSANGFDNFSEKNEYDDDAIARAMLNKTFDDGKQDSSE